jgi:hypothetical protein
MGWNLPPGCTQADIDRAFGGDEECYHEDFEINLEGRATCDRCGERWWPSDDEIRHFREQNAIFDAHWRAEERRERWRQRWERLARPWRWFWYRVLTLFWPRKAVRCLHDDEIPF